MHKGILVVQTRPSAPDREPEYNDWYNNVHLPELLAVPGFRSARRYRLVDDAASESDQPRCIAIYDLEAEDVMDPIRELQRRARTGEIHQSDALQTDPAPISAVYEQAP